LDVLLTLLIMVLCLAAEAFFSGSEIGIVSADRMQLRHKAAQGSRGARLALTMLEKPEWLLSTTLVGTNVAVVTNTTMATALVIHLFGEQFAWLAIIMVAPLIWIFGEIVAKSVFQQRADVTTPVAIFVLRGASWLFLPILVVFSVLTRTLARLLGGGESRNPFTLREEIVTMMDMSAAEGDIQPLERRMIRRVFSFSETTAEDIMVPLIDVVGVPRDSNCRAAQRLARDNAHKRLAVYEERVDRIVGSINVLDLLSQPPDRPIEDFVRRCHFVPGSIGIEGLLSDFRESSGMMAVIVDEFGGAEGIVMLEDILEVIVGELEDEFDAPDTTGAWVRQLGERHYLVGARLGLDRLKDELGLEIPDGNYETLAGFLLEEAKAIPRAGTVIPHGDITFTVERGTLQALQEIRIRW
jgi:putative hemolysin